MLFTGVANAHEPSPQPTACRSASCSLTTATGSNQAQEKNQLIFNDKNSSSYHCQGIDCCIVFFDQKFHQGRIPFLGCVMKAKTREKTLF